MTERHDAYQAGYADALRRVRDALHEGWVRPHADSPGCVLVPDGDRAGRLLCRLFWLTEPSSASPMPAVPVGRTGASLRLLRGGKRA